MRLCGYPVKWAWSACGVFRSNPIFCRHFIYILKPAPYIAKSTLFCGSKDNKNMSFKELGLDDSIIESIGYMGFENPTPIQEQSIPKILSGKDLIACAQTGTGKTAAFLLPVIQQIQAQDNRSGVQALIISPTRELAIQIEQQVQALAYFSGVSSFAVYGGGDADDWLAQKKALKQGADIIVATPGKFISHLKALKLNFKDLKYLVLDEADRMLDIGFYDDILQIIEYLPKKRQTLLFSATMDPGIRKLSQKILHQPDEVNIAIAKPAAGVLQVVYELPEELKMDLVLQLIEDKLQYERILIFCSTKKKVSDLSRALNKKGLSVKAISSDLEQKEREDVLNGFRSKRIRVLVGTDVVSRGIDIKDINLVINFDVPQDAEDYVHRVGRTARANTTGVAITLVNRRDGAGLRKIESLIEEKIQRAPLSPEMQQRADQMSAASSKNNRHKRNRNKGRGRGRSSGRGRRK